MSPDRRAFFDPLVAFYGALTLMCVTALATVGILTGHHGEVLAAGAIITSAGFGLIAHRYARLAPPPLRPGETRITSEISGSPNRAMMLEQISRSRDQDLRRKILIVDDDQDCRDTMGMLLRGMGFKVTEAEDGVEALHVLQGEIPDLILLDLMMPRCNGWEFRALQLEDPRLREIPVIVLSGIGGHEESAQTMGVDFIDKPIDLDALEGLIQGRLPIT